MKHCFLVFPLITVGPKHNLHPWLRAFYQVVVHFWEMKKTVDQCWPSPIPGIAIPTLFKPKNIQKPSQFKNSPEDMSTVYFLHPPINQKKKVYFLHPPIISNSSSPSRFFPRHISRTISGKMAFFTSVSTTQLGSRLASWGQKGSGRAAGDFGSSFLGIPSGKLT